MTYERDLFYDTDDLSPLDKIKIIQNAFDVKSEWRVDKLDCSKSFARQKIEMSFPDIMEKFNNNAHFVVIHRKGFSSEEHIGEVAFRTMSEIEYFLWIYLSVSQLNKIIEKYKLKLLP